jgi:hypothetical protein
MLVQHLAGRSRAFCLGTLLVLLLATLAISAQATHFHQQSEAASAAHCVLCEAGGIPLPILAIVVTSFWDSISMVDPIPVDGAHPSAEGSNLSVRPPPLYKSS